MDMLTEIQKGLLQGRTEIRTILTLMKELSYQCNTTLHQSAIMNFLKEEHYDIAVVDSFNPCTFLVSEKLGLPYIAFLPRIMANADRKKLDSLFDGVIEEHFPAESRPNIPDLHLKAELWFYNVDFTLEFPRPLLPHVQFIGGLLAKPVKPLTQELENFISDSDFIVVTLGSTLSSLTEVDFLKEMNGGLAKIQQKVIWRYQRSEWPKEVEIAPNVKIMDWVSQNDLLGHPKLRLFVTHGGMNSLMEAVYHGAPVLGIPLFGDQNENMVRVKAKHMGTFILPEELKAENFASTIQQVIEDKSYKISAKKLQTIRRSQPFPPDQQLVRWVEHIIQSGGGGHLHPYSYKQPWYQRWLLDVILFLFVSLAAAVYLTVTLFRALVQKLCSSGKLKRN